MISSFLSIFALFSLLSSNLVFRASSKLSKSILVLSAKSFLDSVDTTSLSNSSLNDLYDSLFFNVSL
ncbi:hypothetical protein [Mycoplasmopsis alligatoris]|uniref:hypothetical protein n=1 Tax=Mycoplasmopsis alligatoris TaxID=47687 RepID=UPI0012E9D26E|nr:hypothetical protein [Mycoplasmopsis alligatoris]